jgi:hypothetical protein
MFTDAKIIHPNVVRKELRSSYSSGLGSISTTPDDFFSEGMKNALLREAVRFAECTISNVAQASQLLNRDYTDWPIVTYYYTSFYAICALLRTRGYATTYIGARAYQIEPDLTRSNWWYVSLSGARGHVAIWNQYDDCFSTSPPADWDDLKPLETPNERELWMQRNYQPDIMGEELHWGNPRRKENADLFRADLFRASEVSLTDEQRLLRRSQRRIVAAVQEVITTLHQTRLQHVYVEGIRRLRRAFNQHNHLLPTTLQSELDTALRD